MQTLFLYLGVILVFVCVVIVLYALVYNKMQEKLIRIDEAEVNIDNSLRSKYDLINRAVALVKASENVTDDVFEEIIKLRSRKIGSFDLERKLILAHDELLTQISKYDELEKSDELKKICVTITELDEKVVNYKNYYNDNVLEYNKLIKIFPTNMVAAICRYKSKLFFDKKDMHDADEKDFKL